MLIQLSQLFRFNILANSNIFVAGGSLSQYVKLDLRKDIQKQISKKLNFLEEGYILLTCCFFYDCLLKYF